MIHGKSHRNECVLDSVSYGKEMTTSNVQVIIAYPTDMFVTDYETVHLEMMST